METEDTEVVDELEENTLADDDDLSDDDSVDDADETDTNIPDTKPEADEAEGENTENIDYQKEFQKLEEKAKKAFEFRDKVAGVKFKANGKEVVGFSDPDKLIQAQQLAYNYSAKMAGFKPYREFMAPLKERGILEDPSKFDLAMQLLDGDKNAIAAHLKNLDIDPIEFDLEDESSNYMPEVVRSSADMLAIEDAMEQAKMHGVDDKVYDVVVKDWDDASFKEFVDDQAVQRDLIQHVEDGSYDMVMQKVEQLSVLDPQFANNKMTDKYRHAVKVLNHENAEPGQVQTPTATPEVVTPVESETKTSLEAEIAELTAKKIALENAVKNEAADKARRKATSASKSKPKTSNKPKVIDPMSLDGKGIEAMIDAMMMGK